MMTKKGSTKFCKFHDPRSMGSCPRAWPCKSYIENALSSTLPTYSTLFASVFMDFSAVFLCYCCFLFII